MPANARAIVLGGPFNDNWYWLSYNSSLGYASSKYLVQADGKFTPVPTTEATIEPVASPASGDQPTATPTAPTLAPVTPIPTVEAPVSVPSNPSDYTGLWIGEMAYAGNVRTGPGTTYPVLKGWWVGRRVLLYQSYTDAKGGLWYRVSEPPEGPMYVSASLIRKVAPVRFEPARYKGKWVNVSITQQVVTAYENGTPVKVTLASTGKGKNATDLGVWKIYWRLPKQDMEGGNKAAGDYYNLKDVPYPQYFNMTGESLHGTYWHDDFGRPHSHGCVNLSIPMSEWFYGWDKIGTIVYVHN
jgi:hypothetical protein